MSITGKRWQPAPPAPTRLLRQYKTFHPVIAQILYNRGFQSPQEAVRFLAGRDALPDPFVMKDMDKAVARIRQAVHEREPIVVYGDFDADGVTATTLMCQVLGRLGAMVEPYIPHRVDEGYGLNSEALGSLAEAGKKLIITVDCGIRSVQEVEDGKAAGLDIIVTDHHSVGQELPDALAVVNPQQADCAGDTTLAGVGVALMVARGLLLDAWKRLGKKDKHRKIYEALIDDLLDLVAIGTVADIMPLNSPLNRVLVIRGLKVLNQAKRPGIRALMAVAGVKRGEATATHIGFRLAPRINAAGRLDDAMVACRMLMAESADEAKGYAEKLQALNTERQRLTSDAQKRIQAQLEANGMLDGHLFFAMDDLVEPGIVGLVAGRLTEAYYRPAVILDAGEHESHASCRSIPEFHITQALDECADLLLRHGGHAMAAGFTIANENIPALRETLLEMASQALMDRTLVPVLTVDMKLDLRQVTMNLAEELQVLEPTGHANPSPIFMTQGLRVVACRTVGRDDAHLKLKLADATQPAIDAIGFRMGAWAMEMPECIDVVYHLEINEWQGRRNLQLNLLDIRPAAVAQDA